MVGAEAVENAAGVDGDQAALVDADRSSGRDELEVGARVLAATLVDDHDPAPRSRVAACRLDACVPAADDEHVNLTVLDVVAVRSSCVLVEAAESRDGAKKALVVRPQPPWADHREVVEAHRRERAADLVDDREEVALE